MKVEYIENWDGRWYWRITSHGIYSYNSYVRKRDAVRGLERFCAAIRRVKA